MDQPSVSEQLRQAFSEARKFGKQSSELSDYVQWFVTQISELPGKIETRVSNPDDSVSLMLLRGGKNWALVTGRLNDDNELIPVTSAPIGLKASAAQLFPALLSMLRDQMQREATDVQQALDINADLVKQWKVERDEIPF